jgi:hypothetical protein
MTYSAGAVERAMTIHQALLRDGAPAKPTSPSAALPPVRALRSEPSRPQPAFRTRSAAWVA